MGKLCKLKKHIPGYCRGSEFYDNRDGGRSITFEGKEVKHIDWVSYIISNHFDEFFETQNKQVVVYTDKEPILSNENLFNYRDLIKKSILSEIIRHLIVGSVPTENIDGERCRPHHKDNLEKDLMYILNKYL